MRRPSQPLVTALTLALVLQLFPARAWAEVVAETPDDAPAVVAAEAEEASDAEKSAPDSADDTKGSAGAADETPAATEDEATTSDEPTLAPAAVDADEPALAAQDDTEVNVGDALQYKDVESGYWYFYTILSVDDTDPANPEAITGTARLDTVKYIDESGWYGYSENLPDTITEGSVDYTYPTELGANVSENGVQSNIPGASFAVTELNGLPSLPSWRSVKVPATVTALKNKAYLRETVTLVTFDSACTITEIPAHFFEDERHLESIELPDSIETIGDFAFAGCPFESFAMPASLTDIGASAFAGCTALRMLVWNDQLEHIGEKAFYCAMLTELDLPESLLTIGDYAFSKKMFYGGSYPDQEHYDDDILYESVIIPDKVTSIGDYAFAHDFNVNNTLNAIKTVKLGKSVETIGMNAFEYASITSLELPASLKVLETDEDGWSGPFSNCSLLERVTWEDFEHSQLTSMAGFTYCESLAAMDIPASVTSIAGHALEACKALTSVTIPSGVESIGDQAFNDTALKRVVIPASVKSIGKLTFASCDDLSSVKLNEGLQTIGERAFDGTPSLTSITIPSTVSVIDYGAFEAGIYLGGYDYPSGGGGLTSLTIKGGDTPLVIGDFAFAFCEGLNGKTIVLPERVSSLGCGAFLGISNATYKIYNPAMQLKGDSYYGLQAFLSPDEAQPFIDAGYDAYYDEDEGTYSMVIPDPWSTSMHPLQMYIPSPNGSTVYYPNTLTTEASPTFSTYLHHATLNTHPTFEAFDPAGGGAPDDPDEPVEVAAAGRLLVTTTGDAGSSARIGVYGADGSLVASAKAASGYAVIEGLDAGTYTVVAYASGAGISTVGSLDAFAALGLATTDYARQNGVAIAKNTDTELTLSVPKISTTSSAAILESSSVAITKSSVYPDMEFFAVINFKTSGARQADTLKVMLPAGLTPTSLASVTKNYDVSGFDATTHQLSVALDDVDAQSGRLYLGLKATAKGSYTVNASIVSGSSTAPLGSASVTCNSLSLVVPEVQVQGRVFVVGVYAAPRTQVTLTASGTTQTVTTNANGYVAARIDLSEVETTLSYTIVTASVGTGGGVASTSAMVQLATTQTEPYRLKDFSFVHAGSKYYVVRSSVPLPSSSYYVYIANGKEENKYWTFEATYISDKSFSFEPDTMYEVIPNYTCMLQVQMLDGESRYKEMSLINSQEQDDGTYLNTFACSMYLEQAGDHVFPTSLVPTAFDVTLATPYEKVNPTQADISVLREALYEPLVHFDQRTADKAQQKMADYVDEEITWDRSVDYSWVFFYDMREDPIWECYEKYLEPQEMSQLEQIISDCGEGISAAGEVFDAIIGASTPIAECESITDWTCKNIDYQDSQPFDADSLAADGWNVTSDTNAPSPSTASPTGAGTPTNGISESTTFVPPAQIATKPQYGSDGSLQSVAVRDSNGNGATIPVRKISDNVMNDKASGVNWGSASDMLTHGSIGAGAASDFLKSVDHKANISMTAEEFEQMGSSRSSVYAKHAQGCMNAAICAINQRERIKQSEELGNFFSDAAEARGWADNLDIRLNYRIMHGDTSSPCYKALKNERDWAIIVAGGKDSEAHYRTAELARGELMDVINFTVGTKTGPIGSYGIYTADKMSEAVIADGIDSNRRVLDPALKNLNLAHQLRVENCGDEKLDAKWHKTAVLDPSGVAYEAFPENVLEGVKATVYEVGEGGALTPWAAEDYDQENPQTTGADGSFGWDVPSGKWQVKLEKDGYAAAATDTMEVPPPRTGLKVPMVATAGPTVTSVTADTQSIEIAFDQWMDAQTLYAATVNGDEAEADWADPTYTEEYHEDEDATYLVGFSKVLRVTAPAGTKAGDTLTVKLDNAKNYAGKKLGAKTFTVEVKPRPTTLALNFEDTISLQAGTSRPTSVRVYDGEGKPMEGVQLTAAVDNAYLATVDAAAAVTNADGVAKLQLEALLPGMCTLTVGVEGAPLERSLALLTTVDANTVARPTAVIGTTTVGAGAPAENAINAKEGDTLTLACATEGATIYYTTDGSCPCQNTAGRQEYRGPITLTESVNLIVGAYKDGMDYSERLKLNVTVTPKEASTLVVKGSTKQVLAPAAASKAQTVAGLSVSGAHGAVTYKKLSGSAKLSVNAKGQIVVAKGTAVGSYSIKVRVADKGDETYRAGSKDVTVKVNVVKAAQTLKIKAVNKAAKLATVKAKNVVVARPMKVTGAKGKLSFKRAGGAKVLTVNAKTGKVTVKKGTKKGTYTIKIEVTAATTATYKAATKTVACKVIVK